MEFKKKVNVAFFSEPTGACPVRDWLRELSKDDRAELGSALRKLEFAWPVGMPHCRPLGGGLFELRRSISQGLAARIIFVVFGGELVLLVGFIKKTQKTPEQYMDLARRRLSTLQRGA